jgi:hypothetical protein
MVLLQLPDVAQLQSMCRSRKGIPKYTLLLPPLLYVIVLLVTVPVTGVRQRVGDEQQQMR